MTAPSGWTHQPPARGARAVQSWARWVLAGRPRRLPVVQVRGGIDVCQHGQIHFRDWSLDFARSELKPTPADLPELVRGLEERYGHTLVSSVPGCLDCDWVRGRP